MRRNTKYRLAMVGLLAAMVLSGCNKKEEMPTENSKVETESAKEEGVDTKSDKVKVRKHYKKENKASNTSNESEKKETEARDDSSGAAFVSILEGANKGIVAFNLEAYRNHEDEQTAVKLFISKEDFDLKENDLYFINSSGGKEYMKYYNTPRKEKRSLSDIECYKSPETEYTFYIVAMYAEDKGQDIQYAHLYWNDGTDVSMAGGLYTTWGSGEKVIRNSEIGVIDAKGKYASDCKIRISSSKFQEEIGTGERSFELVVEGDFPEQGYMFSIGSTIVKLNDVDSVKEATTERETTKVLFDNEDAAPKTAEEFVDFLRREAKIRNVAWKVEGVKKIETSTAMIAEITELSYEIVD